MKIKTKPFFFFFFLVSVLGTSAFISVKSLFFKSDDESKMVIVFDLNQSMIADYLRNPFPFPVKSVACGKDHCYALTFEGSVYSIGRNNIGQLGIGDRTDRAEWTKTPLSNVSQVSAGDSHGYAVINGDLYATGDSRYGQFGIPGFTDPDRYQIIDNWVFTGLRGVSYALAANNSGYAIVNRNLYVTGVNDKGQLGVGHVENVERWTPSVISGVDAISAHYRHAYALVNGSVMAVGDNYRGQLSNGERGYHKYQTHWISTGLGGVSKVVAGRDHGYAIQNGTLFVVGRNYEGQLGIGGRSPEFFWHNTGISGVTDISAGDNFGHAVINNELHSAGQNHYGQLGIRQEMSLGSRRETWTSTGVMNPKMIASGNNFSYLVLHDGTMMVSGNNYYRKLAIDSALSQNRFMPSVLIDRTMIPVFDIDFMIRFYGERTKSSVTQLQEKNAEP